MEKQRIYKTNPTTDGVLTGSEMMQIAALLVKVGYAVKIGKEKRGNSSVKYIEFWME